MMTVIIVHTQETAVVVKFVCAMQLHTWDTPKEVHIVLIKVQKNLLRVNNTN